jgi:hypothetical protein
MLLELSGDIRRNTRGNDHLAAAQRRFDLVGSDPRFLDLIFVQIFLEGTIGHPLRRRVQAEPRAGGQPGKAENSEGEE